MHIYSIIAAHMENEKSTSKSECRKYEKKLEKFAKFAFENHFNHSENGNNFSSAMNKFELVEIQLYVLAYSV